MENNIRRWLQKGLIDKKTSEKLLEDIKNEKSQNSKIRFNIFIYTLAAICIGIGIVAFIAANDWIIKLFNRKPIIRIISLFIMSILSLLSGYIFAYKKKNFPRLGHSLIFLSSILIGTTYTLGWKTYDIKNHFDTLMFIWLFSILPIAYLFKDIATNILSIFVFFAASFLIKWDGMSHELYNYSVIIPHVYADSYENCKGFFSSKKLTQSKRYTSFIECNKGRQMHCLLLSEDALLL